MYCIIGFSTFQTGTRRSHLALLNTDSSGNQNRLSYLPDGSVRSFDVSDSGRTYILLDRVTSHLVSQALLTYDDTGRLLENNVFSEDINHIVWADGRVVGISSNSIVDHLNEPEKISRLLVPTSGWLLRTTGPEAHLAVVESRTATVHLISLDSGVQKTIQPDVQFFKDMAEQRRRELEKYARGGVPPEAPAMIRAVTSGPEGSLFMRLPAYAPEVRESAVIEVSQTGVLLRTIELSLPILAGDSSASERNLTGLQVTARNIYVLDRRGFLLDYKLP